MGCDGGFVIIWFPESILGDLYSPILISSESRLAFSPDLPTAITILPQFGSQPAIAVLTKGEFAIAIAMTFAALFDAAPETEIVTNFEAPSPSRTICCAKLLVTLLRASRNPLSSGSLRWAGDLLPAVPVAQRRTVSLVEVSPSTVTALKDCSTDALRQD